MDFDREVRCSIPVLMSIPAVSILVLVDFDREGTAHSGAQRPAGRVSILVLVDFDREAPLHPLHGISQACFNPCFSGL